MRINTDISFVTQRLELLQFSDCNDRRIDSIYAYPDQVFGDYSALLIGFHLMFLDDFGYMAFYSSFI